MPGKNKGGHALSDRTNASAREEQSPGMQAVLVCECGAAVKQSGMKAHIKTKKHLAHVREQTSMLAETGVDRVRRQLAGIDRSDLEALEAAGLLVAGSVDAAVELLTARQAKMRTCKLTAKQAAVEEHRKKIEAITETRYVPGSQRYEMQEVPAFHSDSTREYYRGPYVWDSDQDMPAIPGEKDDHILVRTFRARMAEDVSDKVFSAKDVRWLEKWLLEVAIPLPHTAAACAKDEDLPQPWLEKWLLEVAIPQGCYT